MQTRLLLVEDDPEIARVVRDMSFEKVMKLLGQRRDSKAGKSKIIVSRFT